MQDVLRFKLSVVAKYYFYLRREADIYNADLGDNR